MIVLLVKTIIEASVHVIHLQSLVNYQQFKYSEDQP